MVGEEVSGETDEAGAADGDDDDGACDWPVAEVEACDTEEEVLLPAED